jgi:N-methylhydantoinase A
VEAGAGGGSIAWIDDSGALRVGPRSAGAEPGPVCYGRGGTDPTVTDANVMLGYMNPDAIAGSRLRIDRDGAHQAVQRELAQPLGLDPISVAYGITQVANSAMTRVLRAVSTERGRDPREFTLLAFGGAGPIHAAALAESMEISRIVVPVYPGLFSALGLLLADYRHDYIASIAALLDSIRPDEVLARYDDLENAARAELVSEGIAAAAIRVERYVDLKYGYQMYEMTRPFPTSASSELRAVLARIFTDAHRQAYGYHRDDPIELVSIRLRALASAGSIRFTDLAAKLSARNQNATQSATSREAYFGPRHGSVITAVRHRFDIAGSQPGPVIIEEPDTTVVVPPGWMVERDTFANLLLTRN